MKTYSKPNMIVMQIQMNMQLLNMSGGGNQIQGGSNGDYNTGVTIGARGGWFDEDEE